MLPRHRAPLYEQMIQHADGNSASFHVPGHKSGRGAMNWQAPFYESILKIDYTEIPGLDDLHQPEGAIREAQELAADCFGAEETHFLVGGSTVGNLAMILSVCRRGDLLLVQRNAHKSIIHGLMLAGVRAVFLIPQWDQESGIAAGVRLEDVSSALCTYPEAKGLLITNPNYFGMGQQLKPIADLMHAHGKPLLVDEAHGAHYGFHPELPPSALSSGADAVVQSTHKMLTAMTMGAMLHVQGSLIDRSEIKRQLTILQSSSPSYPILASLDLARRQMHIQGEADIQKGMDTVRFFRKRMEELPRFEIVSPTVNSVFDTLDPFKITVSDRRGVMSGPEIQRNLESKGCYVELATPRQVLLLFTLASTQEEAARASNAFRRMESDFCINKEELKAQAANMMNNPHVSSISAPVVFDLHPNTERINQSRSVPIHQAAGLYSAEMVIPYPPGIPVLYPGELITTETARYLEELAVQGIRFHGSREATAGYLQVY